MMIRRQKTTIFTDAKENTSVMELKRILEGILKVAPENQKLFKDDNEMENTKSLQVRLETGWWCVWVEMLLVEESLWSKVLIFCE